MPHFLLPYHSLLVAHTVLAALVLVQFGIADVTGIRRRHVPGMPVTGGHEDFLFRATRALANSQENLALWLLVALTALLLGAAPGWTNGLAWLFVAARAAHMLCYYLDLRTLRSIAFAVGALATVGMLVLCVLTLW